MTSPSKLRRLVPTLHGADARIGPAAVGTVVLNLGGTALRLGIQVALSRWLGSTGYGRFVVMRGWGGLLGRLPNRGYHLALVRWLPRLASDGQPGAARLLVRSALRTTLIGAICLTLAAMLFSVVVLDDRSATTLIGLTFIVGTATMQLYRHVFQASFRHVLGVTTTEVLHPAIFGALACTFALVVGRSVAASLLALSLAAAIVTIGQAVVVHRSLPPASANEPPPDEDRWRRGTLPLFGGQIGIAALEVQYVLVIGAVVGPREAGIFAVAQRVALLGRMGNSAVESVIGPQFSRLATDEPGASGRMQAVVDRGIRMSAALTGPACVVLLVVADLVLGVFGSEFTAGRTALWVLLVGNVVNALTGPTGYLVSMTGSEVIYGYVMMGHAIAGASLGALVAWQWGSAAGVAAVATAVTVSWNVWLIRIGGARLGVWCVPRPIRSVLGLRTQQR